MSDTIIIGPTPGTMTAEQVKQYIETSPELSGLTRKDKADAALRLLGLKTTKRKYATPEERKAAQAKRRKDRKAERTSELDRLGLAPQPRGPKKTREEKRAHRRIKSQDKREFNRQMALKFPDMARQFGIDPDRIKALAGKTKPKAEPKPKKKKTGTKKK